MSLEVNPGIIDVSPFRPGQPTLVSGSGRSGTTAMARCFCSSPGVRFVATSVAYESNLEVEGMTPSEIRAEPEKLGRFRERVSCEYSPEFVWKCPLLHACSDILRDYWAGANIVLMVRCPVATARREISVAQVYRSDLRHLEEAVERLRRLVKCASRASDCVGIVVVSYEKLLTSTQSVVGALNQWLGSDVLDYVRCEECVTANHEGYLNRQKPAPDVCNEEADINQK